ncbi:hypothetical protein AgCh_034203 [Apium graveolens]
MYQDWWVIIVYKVPISSTYGAQRLDILRHVEIQGIESVSKLGDSIYFEQQGQVPEIYVIQYISSSVNWESGNVLVVQKVKSGVVYALEFSNRSGRDLVNMAKKRTNVIPIIEDARHPAKYHMLVGMVYVIFSDVAQPDQEMMSLLGFPFRIYCWRKDLPRVGARNGE